MITAVIQVITREASVQCVQELIIHQDMILGDVQRNANDKDLIP